MTSLFKYIAFVSAVIFCISAASYAILVFTKPPPVAVTVQRPDTTVRVAVLNGCGREGLASVGAKRLRSLGIDVVNGLGSNADSFDFDTSVIVDRRGNKEMARFCADKTGIMDIINQQIDNPYIIEDFVIILGRDWDSLKLFKEVENE
ncbi:LytR C-terminal domain-containing protein [Candidatus Latescibacterota bacterium]